jgi:hypothetical protein
LAGLLIGEESIVFEKYFLIAPRGKNFQPLADFLAQFNFGFGGREVHANFRQLSRRSLIFFSTPCSVGS